MPEQSQILGNMQNTMLKSTPPEIEGNNDRSNHSDMETDNPDESGHHINSQEPNEHANSRQILETEKQLQEYAGKVQKCN